ncbi:MAG: hypothetical protein FWG14_02545 [Peptococcaceae bacterium]|nr:hypothetical protein [Peptococcaceae bacterium]
MTYIDTDPDAFERSEKEGVIKWMRSKTNGEDMVDKCSQSRYTAEMLVGNQF